MLRRFSSSVFGSAIGHSRRCSSNSKDPVKERVVEQFALMQPGLVYPSPFAVFATFAPKDPQRSAEKGLDRNEVAKVVKAVRERFPCQSCCSSAVFGVSFAVFKSWCQQSKATVPKGMRFAQGDTTPIFTDSNGTFVDSNGAVWVHMKSDDPVVPNEMLKFIQDELAKLPSCPLQLLFSEYGNSRTCPEKPNGAVLGCRFSENVNNPADPISLATHTLVGPEDPTHMGASFAISQRFLINWDKLHNMTDTQIEDVIGRTKEDAILAGYNSLSHIVSSRHRDRRGNTTFVLRLGLPFGRSPYDSDDIKYKGGTVRDEAGNYFAGFANSAKVLEAVMKQQIGDPKTNGSGFMRDRLFSVARSNGGGFFYIPSDRDLFEAGFREKLYQLGEIPGVNWNYILRHSTPMLHHAPNGRMQYNHKQYLFNMATKPASLKLEPPSFRVLTLMANSFARWQDSWYFPKGKLELGHIAQHLKGSGAPPNLMELPVNIRRAWAIRLTLRTLATKEFGCRGPYAKWSTRYRAQRDITGTDPTPVDLINVEGADSFRIHPLELIVGAMPDMTLTQGNYTMQYLTDDERKAAFLRGLSESSAVGHIVPDFQLLVDKGISGILADLTARRDASADQSKKDFYEGCIIAYQGVQDYLERYEKLAAETAASFTSAKQTLERENLLAIAARLAALRSHAPKTFLEAAQLIYTVFTCLHYTGEVVSFGRVDQYLSRFFEAEKRSGALTDEAAQEIIDCFCLKVDEKVLQNRIFAQDHQTFGNLAMGGASGPYPKGASLGQWIHQLTVGGVVADDSPTPKSAYNEVTVMYLRALARLPLNAPCISLRVHKDTPKAILEEAAKALLSGGAHPILLNDDKLIAAMQSMGEGVGGAVVPKAAGEQWRSSVSLRSARNYACDGCYEPMIVGENWFTLGGFTTLDPLECALNEGRTYGAAGPTFLLGKTVSLRSVPPTEIVTFEQLLSLYFMHFEFLTRRSLHGQLGTFDSLVSVCPAPLLSPLIHDCTARGRDLYGGGARYNIYGPCFIALTATINSLWGVYKMVFDPKTACTSLPELVQCLMCDWGNNMVEPFISDRAGPVRTQARAERFKYLRQVALSQAKFGLGTQAAPASPFEPSKPDTYCITGLGRYLTGRIATITADVFRDPLPPTADMMLSYAKKYGTKEFPFGFQIQPGCGTFENFVSFGVGSGASADGRRNNGWINSDISAMPSVPEQKPQAANFERALEEFTSPDMDKLWDGAPIDFNIDESVSVERLTQLLAQFAHEGKGTNILTITTANTETFVNAVKQPERYDCVRVRMGGWTEFFTSMFPESQQQHIHRPRYSTDKPAPASDGPRCPHNATSL